MLVEIINTGSELLLGRVLNTHQQWLCRQLADRGYLVRQQTAIADAGDEIERTVRETLSRADLIITTGGLGPTSDDITRDVVARLLGRKLLLDESVRSQIENFFSHRGRPMPERTRLEALVPEGATVLPNHHGTAPGLALKVDPNPFRADHKASWLILLPGPPRELQPMFTGFVLPLLEHAFPVREPFVCRTLRTVGLGESVVQERIEKSLQPLVDAGLELGYCARPGLVDVRLSVRGIRAENLMARAEEIVRGQLGPAIFGGNEDSLETVTVRALIQRNETLAVAESCTGGCIANRLTNVPGASAVFLGGFVTYANEMKQSCLGVRAESLTTHGAVSEMVAREMADGVRRASCSDYGIGVTGIAGPDGGTPDKPVGTVFIAVASSKKVIAHRLFHPWDRITFKEVTCQQALNLLRMELEE